MIQRAAGFPVASAWALAASKEFWEDKPSTEWSAGEVDRMLTKSPWAKEATVSFGGAPGGFGGGNGGGGGTGRSRGGMGGGGIGFPGGGIGFPGGGIGFPGGGGQRGGGGGYPGGGGGRPTDGGGERRTFNGTVRWESALPVQEALRIGVDDEKPNPDFARYYVIHLLGDLPPARGRRRSSNGDDGNSDDDDNDRNERRLEMLKEDTRLERKDGRVKLERVEEGSRVGSRGPGIYFYFSRLDDISMDDKVVNFSAKVDRMEIKARFTLKDMRYQGKLAL
jgi:hypothetical protein